MKLSDKEIRAFQKEVYRHYKKEARAFPWRETKRPYHIFVSEIMLQQTQAGPRTVSKYHLFLKTFPSFKKLAQASLKDVLSVWQGLGYNRRAKALKEAATIITNKYGGRLPNTAEELTALPSVGPYTAGALLAFAYNIPAVFIETNIRTVFLRFFFKNKKGVVSDSDIHALVEQTLDVKNPRKWYWALMDYGAMLKKQGKSQNSKSKHYTKQGTFAGSDREIRGKIVILLLERGNMGISEFAQHIHRDKQKIQQQLAKLSIEELLYCKNGIYSIKS